MKNILEKQFYSCYLMGLSVKDTDLMDYMEFDWFYNRLIQQKEEELKVRRRGIRYGR